MTNCMRELGLSRSFLDEKYKTSKLPNLHKKYRSHFEIIALILEGAKGEGASLSYVMRYAGTSHTQFKKYLVSLVEMGYVDVNTKKGQVLYRASEKGLAFLRQYYVLLGMLLSACKEDNRLTLSPKLNMYLIDKTAHQHALRHDS